MAPQTRPTTSTLITALLLALSAALGAQAACYYPNGIDRNAEEESKPYRPCTSTDSSSSSSSSSSLSSTSNETEEASMCCRTRDWDDCRSDGLCQVNNITWRESCTDKTWKAKGCVKLCVDGSLANQDVPVMRCADESWCCANDGSNPADCCSRGQGKWIDDEKQVVTTRPTRLAAASTVVVAESKASSATTSGAASTTSNSGSSDSSSSGTGAIIGGVVGGVGGALVIVAAAFFLLWSRRRARGDAEIDSKHSQRVPLRRSDLVFEMEHHPKKDAAVHQYSAPEPIYEAASSQQPALQELDAHNYHGETGR